MGERWLTEESWAEPPEELQHDLRNALTSVKGYAQMALRYAPSDADTRLIRALEAIRAGVDRACRLLKEDHTGPVTQEWDLRLLVERAASQLPPERWDDLTVRPLTDAPLIGSWDGERVSRIVANLLDNAAKYSLPGTPIEVELARIMDRGQPWALVAVRDQGIGLAPEDLPRIFAGHRTAAARRLAPGSGLGLQLSRRLAAAEGGQLWALGSPGRGSVFYLLLPLLPPEAA
jgi:two-component system sensor histidine kinase MprB